MTSAGMRVDNGQLGNVLGVRAHPDDEAYLSGGLMASAVDGGRRAVCVTATYGEAGFPDGDPRSAEQRAALRADECAASMAELGVSEHHWLGYPDGGCHLVDAAEPVAKIAELIDEIRPDTVLTFGPDGMTGHSDHIAASRWTTQAVQLADTGCRLLYATKTPEWNTRMSTYIDLGQVMMVEGMDPPAEDPATLPVVFTATGRLLDRKVRALLAQASQVRPLYDLVEPAAFADLVAEEFFRDPRTDDWPDTAEAGRQ
jgi:LmbE family N-acetylglucosaminyl deacetylase